MELPFVARRHKTSEMQKNGIKGSNYFSSITWPNNIFWHYHIIKALITHDILRHFDNFYLLISGCYSGSQPFWVTTHFSEIYFWWHIWVTEYLHVSVEMANLYVFFTKWNPKIIWWHTGKKLATHKCVATPWLRTTGISSWRNARYSMLF